MAKNEEFNEKTFLEGFELVPNPRQKLWDVVRIKIKHITIAKNLFQNRPIPDQVLLYYDPEGKRLAIASAPKGASDAYTIRQIKKGCSYTINRSHEFVVGDYPAKVIGGKFIVAEGIKKNPLQAANEEEEE